MSEERRYLINEVFYSIQGEGVLAGTAMVFVRFSKCNMRCSVEEGPRSPGGFDCDTEFESGVRMTAEEILGAVAAAPGRCRSCGCTEERACDGGCWWATAGLCSSCAFEGTAGPGPRGWAPAGGDWVLLTGGEPGLQVDDDLCERFRLRGYRLAIETNGSVVLPGFGDHAEGVGLDDVLARSPFDHVTVSPKVAEHAIRQRWAHEVRYVRGIGQGIPETQVNALHRLISPAAWGDYLDPLTIQCCVDMVRRDPSWRLSVQFHKAWMVR